jgi:hypothetical protein
MKESSQGAGCLQAIFGNNYQEKSIPLEPDDFMVQVDIPLAQKVLNIPKR